MTTLLIRQSNDFVGMAYSTIESAKRLGTNRESSFAKRTIKKVALPVNEILGLVLRLRNLAPGRRIHFLSGKPTHCNGFFRHAAASLNEGPLPVQSV